MCKEIKIINQQEILGKDFKIYGTIENPLFLAKEVSNWIEHSDTSKMVKSIDEDEKVKNVVPTLGGIQEAWFLTLNGVKQVLANSRKSKAKEMLSKLDDKFKYKNTPKQTNFELMLKKAIKCHLKDTKLDWKFCPFNSKEDYLLTYDKSLIYETEKWFGEYRVDFYFPKFNLIVEYDEKHHECQQKEDEKREKTLKKMNELIEIIRVKENEEFEGIIKIISYLVHYAFVC